MTQVDSIFEAAVVSFGVILAGMIKIPPIQVNFWSWLGRQVGKAINGEVIEKVDGLGEELHSFKKEEELERVRQARQRILRFSDEVLYAKRHSKEHFDEILEDIDLYEDYCREHKDYENNKAVLAITTIREVYKKCLQEHDFLVYTKK